RIRPFQAQREAPMAQDLSNTAQAALRAPIDERLLSTLGVGVPDGLLRLVLTFLIARLGPNRVSPGVRFGLAYEPSGKEILPPLLFAVDSLAAPVPPDNRSASLEQGLLGSEVTESDVTGTKRLGGVT